jgi:FAD/FMN-containing dehydrogenase
VEALAAVKAAAGDDGWSDDPVRIEPKLVDWRGRWRGNTPLLLLPRSTQEVARLVGVCAQHGVAITPQGGNTGLVGGQLPDGEILLSLERMRAVREVAPLDDAIVIEAGATLADAQEAAASADRLFPVSLAAEGTATIGGAISTNAGGINVVRYGMMRDQVLGLEAVLPNGEVFQGLKRLRKDNTGYDLKQLLIGAEGTLGVITAASLKLHARPRSRATAVVSLSSPADAIGLLMRAKHEAGGGVEAFELMGRINIELALAHIPGSRDPLATAYPWYALVELGSGEPDGALAAMERLLAGAFEEGLILDGALAQNEAQRRSFWKVREEQTDAQKPEGAVWSHDVSVPISRIADFIEQATQAVLARYDGARVVAFGHVGDGNVHFNVLQPRGADRAAFAALRDEGARVVHDVVAAFDGSISAEHGLGTMKSAEAARYKSPAELEALRAVRRALDPRRIMNPRVLF